MIEIFNQPFPILGGRNSQLIFTAFQPVDGDFNPCRFPDCSFKGVHNLGIIRCTADRSRRKALAIEQKTVCKRTLAIFRRNFKLRQFTFHFCGEGHRFTLLLFFNISVLDADIIAERQ